MNTAPDTLPVRRATDHLAGVTLRNAPAAGAPAPDYPHGEPWSYEQTLAELRRRGAVLVDAEPGVRLADRRRPPAALARALAHHGPALRTALRLGVLDGSVPARWAARGWDDATQLQAAWFGLAFAPSGAVELGGGRRITDMQRFRDAVAQRLAAGPAAPGADALATDLSALYSRFGPVPAAMRILRATRPLAA